MSAVESPRNSKLRSANRVDQVDVYLSIAITVKRITAFAGAWRYPETAEILDKFSLITEFRLATKMRKLFVSLVQIRRPQQPQYQTPQTLSQT